jgi:hypothetical protein
MRGSKNSYLFVILNLFQNLSSWFLLIMDSGPEFRDRMIISRTSLMIKYLHIDDYECKDTCKRRNHIRHNLERNLIMFMAY